MLKEFSIIFALYINAEAANENAIFLLCLLIFIFILRTCICIYKYICMYANVCGYHKVRVRFKLS